MLTTDERVLYFTTMITKWVMFVGSCIVMLVACLGFLNEEFLACWGMGMSAFYVINDLFTWLLQESISSRYEEYEKKHFK